MPKYFHRKRAAFHEQLRTAIEGLDVTQSIAADILGISLGQLERWLAVPGTANSQVPHHLMQLGALQLLYTRRTSRNKSIKGRTPAKRWLVSIGGEGAWREVLNLRSWVRTCVPEAELETIYYRLKKTGSDAKYNLHARRVEQPTPTKE